MYIPREGSSTSLQNGYNSPQFNGTHNVPANTHKAKS